MVSSFAIVANAALASLASAQGPANCAAGVQICGTVCCAGPAAAFNCENGACIPVTNPAFPSVVTSVTGITLVTTSPAGVPTETVAPNTTVSVPVVSVSEITIVTTTNVTSWSTTALPTGNHTETNASHTSHATSTHTDKPVTSGAAGVVQAGTGLLGAALAAALGAL